jgi:hypothetical protein
MERSQRRNVRGSDVSTSCEGNGRNSG